MSKLEQKNRNIKNDSRKGKTHENSTKENHCQNTRLRKRQTKTGSNNIQGSRISAKTWRVTLPKSNILNPTERGNENNEGQDQSQNPKAQTQKRKAKCANSKAQTSKSLSQNANTTNKKDSAQQMSRRGCDRRQHVAGSSNANHQRTNQRRF